MAKTYLELMGSLGRGIFFRAERTPARELLSPESAPTLIVNGRSHRLYDLSIGGISFLSKAPANEWPTDHECDLTLELHGETVFESKARVARSEPGHGGCRVGVAFIGGFLDLQRLKQIDEETRRASELSQGPEQVFAEVSTEYAAVLSEAVHFVCYYRDVLNRHQSRYEGEGKYQEPVIAALAQEALATIRPRWQELCARASAAATPLLGKPKAFAAAKRLTETMLTPLLMGSPMPSRAYKQPLGYPGDYQVMNYYYRNALEGSSAFERVFHKLFVEHPLSSGVRTRSDFVVDKLVEEPKHEGQPFAVMSLGCGPAREVPAFAERPSSERTQITWTLVDQEEETLAVAYHAGRKALAGSAVESKLQCLNLSFVQILNEPNLLPQEEQQVIFSTGLFDYLRTERAQPLVEALYGRLASGGLLMVGNALGPNQHFWSPEFILDWPLLYRTRDEMFELGASLPEGAEIDVLVEPGGAYYMLMVRKP